jgi:hypothetical protein
MKSLSRVKRVPGLLFFVAAAGALAVFFFQQYQFHRYFG